MCEWGEDETTGMLVLSGCDATAHGRDADACSGGCFGDGDGSRLEYWYGSCRSVTHSLAGTSLDGKGRGLRMRGGWEERRGGRGEQRVI